MYTAEELRDKIEIEGFDYFFGDYVDVRELPTEGLVNYCNRFKSAKEDLMQELNDYLESEDLEVIY